MNPKLHTHRKWTRVSSSAPHLDKGLLVKPIKLRCLLMVLCLVRRPIRTLDCVQLKDSNLVLLVGLGPEISFRVCLWVLLGPHHIAICWFSTQHFIFSFIFCLETPKGGSGPTNFWTEHSVASWSVISEIGIGGLWGSVRLCTFGMFGSWWQLRRGAVGSDWFVWEEGMYMCKNGSADCKNCS